MQKTIFYFLIAFLISFAFKSNAQTITFEDYQFVRKEKGTLLAELGEFDVPENRLNNRSKNITLSFMKFKSANSYSKILFSRSSGGINTGGTLDLMMYNPETKKTKLVLKGTVSRRGEYNASTSSDNSKIIFNTYKFSGWKLAIADFKNSKLTNAKKLTNRNSYEYNGSFSPNNAKIVYQEFNWDTNKSDIYIADQNGKNATYFYNSKISDQNLAWTRNSKSIVFTSPIESRKSVHYKICIKSIDGNSFKILNSDETNNFAPSTSKVSDKIAFLSDKNGKIGLFVMDLDGKNLKSLTPNLKAKDANVNNLWAYNTSWSPDGKQIVFNVMIDTNLELFIVNSDGTKLTQITKNNDTDITPYWMN